MLTPAQASRIADKHQARRLYAQSSMPELQGELDEARYKAASYAAPGPQQNLLLEAYFLAEAGMVMAAMRGVIARALRA